MSGNYEIVGFYRRGDVDRKNLATARRAGRTPPNEPGDWPYSDFYRDPEENPDAATEDDDLIFA